MKTVKLYDQNAYLDRFSSVVLSVEETPKGFDTVLAETVFFPEEGGQTADTGTLGGVRVLDVKLKDGVLHHYLEKPLPVGETAEGIIDFALRFEKMQCHSGEHIVSGLFHSRYGIENVGFHLGSEEVTLDTSAPVTPGMLSEISALANEAIYKNLPIDARYPSSEELSAMTYRSKLALTEDVRIVTVPGYDVCACCAPHVHRTGEIGSILLIATEKHKQGTRITMLAGKRAERYTAALLSSAHEAAVLLSAGNLELPASVSALLEERNALKYELSDFHKKAAAEKANAVPATDGNAVCYLENASSDEMIAFANTAVPKIGKTLAVLTGAEPNFRYLLMCREGEIRDVCFAMNKALNGRGGGKGNMAQGTLTATLEDVKKYFS